MPKDTHSTLPADTELVLPDQVTVALAELAGAARQASSSWPLGPALGCWGVWWTPMSSGWSAPGPPHPAAGRGPSRHPARPSHPRRPQGPGRPAAGPQRDGTAELALPTWQALAGTELWDQLAVERMLAKLSTRRYHHGWSRSAAEPNRPARGPPGRRCRAGSWPEGASLLVSLHDPDARPIRKGSPLGDFAVCGGSYAAGRMV